MYKSINEYISFIDKTINDLTTYVENNKTDKIKSTIDNFNNKSLVMIDKIKEENSTRTLNEDDHKPLSIFFYTDDGSDTFNLNTINTEIQKLLTEIDTFYKDKDLETMLKDKFSEDIVTFAEQPIPDTVVERSKKIQELLLKYPRIETYPSYMNYRREFINTFVYDYIIKKYITWDITQMKKDITAKKNEKNEKNNS